MSVEFRNSPNGPSRFGDVRNQKTGLPVLDHLTARAEVHGDHRHASGIGFDQHKSESFRDGVQVQENSSPSKQFVLALHVHWPDIENIVIVEMGLDLLPEVVFVLDDTGSDKTVSAETINPNCDV